ncbi:amino acid adenylation domain-containing protein [Micromonospora sp. NPDC049048]|uniref:non-ribosomal peptide synthetase n=1 Tax=Micromonospora sp. NPDC049048 TaxID=3364263 RepID=UPI0037114395
MPEPVQSGASPSPSDRRELLRQRIVRSLSVKDEGVREAAVLRSAPAEEQREPFPLTDLQAAYWVGRREGQRLGGTACHGYLELDVRELDVDRLSRACDRLVQRHPMLRAVIDDDGNQRVLDEVPSYRIPVADATGPDGGRLLDDIRDEMSHQVLRADQWPLFDLRATRTGESTSRLHISFDILIADALSFRILAVELADLYEDADRELPAIGVTFRDYVTHLNRADDGAREADWAYWRERIEALPPAPDLPVRPAAEQPEIPRFSRLETRLSAETWAAVRKLAGAAGVAPAGTVLGAFAEALGVWTAAPRFTLNLTLFDRRPVHPDIDRVVGPFTNISLLGADLAAAGSFTELAASLQRQMWSDLEHRQVSGVEVLRELARRRGGESAMPVVFTYVQDPGNDDFRTDLSRLGTIHYALSQTPQVLIDCQVSESAGEVWVWWDVVADAFPDGLLAEMFAAFTDLLGELAEPAAWAAARPARPPAAVAALRESTEPVAELPVRPLHELVTEAADRWPDRTALVDPDARLDYAGLRDAATALAVRLTDAGVTAGELVGVHARDGIDRAVGVLGVQLAGGAYLPLDANLPAGRLTELARRGGIRTLVVGAHDLRPEWASEQLVVLTARSGAGGPVDVPAPGRLPEVPLDQSAYVVFTSGSTGAPKGVQVSHRAAANTVLDVNQRYGVDERDRVFAVSSIGFDLSVWDIFGTLAAGATVVSAEPGQAGKDPARWLARMQAERVTVWNSAPALMNLFVDVCELRSAVLPDLRLVLLSGDWIPLNLPARIRRVAPNARVVSLGGATEAAIWSVAYDVRDGDRGWSSVPYGFPLTNQRLYVLDEAGRERPVGVAGDLYIGGVGLAQGYWDAPELTAAAFVEHERLGRLYRTGDLARRHPDGCLEFLGRRDGQVKIQGHRVELAEVEAALVRLPDVQSAAVAAVGPRDGQRQLVAYLVPADERLDVSALRTALGASLPEYLVPSRFLVVESLPVSANGKLDRARLLELSPPVPAEPEPAATAPLPVETAPRTPRPFAEYLLGLARQATGNDQLGLDDDLMLAGLDSVDLVRLCNVLERELDFRPPYEELVRNPRVAAIERMLESDLLDRLRAGGRIGSGSGDGDEQAPSAELVQRAVLRHRTLHSLAGRSMPAPDAATDLDLYRDSASWRGGDGAGAVTGEQLGSLLSVLRAVELDGRSKFRYPSAGGLYAVRTFVHVRPSRVDGLAPGVYFYNPVAHRLAMFASAVGFDPEWFGGVNRPVAGAAAFAVYLAADSAAISQKYGARTARFAALEAGSMAMLLRQDAARHGLGLCQIGGFADDAVIQCLGLDQREDLLTTVLGGPVGGGAALDYEEGFV